MGEHATQMGELVELESTGAVVDSYGRALSHREVAEELVELGFAGDDAARAVAQYIDDTSERLGFRVDDWTLDTADVDAIAAMACASARSAAAAGDVGDEAGEPTAEVGEDLAKVTADTDQDGEC